MRSYGIAEVASQIDTSFGFFHFALSDDFLFFAFQLRRW